MKIRNNFLKEAGVLLIAIFIVLSTMAVSGIGNFQGPPEKPTINGPTEGEVDIEYIFCTSTTDPENEDMYYWIDWGDGTNTGWIGPYPSGMEVCLYHTYTSSGTFCIKVKAKDIGDVESEWSDPLCIDISGECDNFMGLEVCPLGDALLDINDDMRVWNLDDDGDDGVWVNLEDTYNVYTCTIDNAIQSDESFIMAKFSGTYDGESYWISMYLGNGSQISGKGVYPVGFSGAASGAPSIIALDEDCQGDNVMVFYETLEALGPMGTITIDGEKGVYPVGFSGAASGAPSIIVQDPVCDDGVTWIWNCEELDVDNLEITHLMVRMGTPNEPLDGLIEDVSIYAAYMEEFNMDVHYAYELDLPAEPGIDGPTSGNPGTAYDYTITNTGIDDVYFFVDWDDGSELEYTELTAPAGTATVSHTWTAEGTYTIKARAMDEWGAMSDWTELGVNIPRNRAIYRPLLLQLFERLPILFSILKYILRFQ